MATRLSRGARPPTRLVVACLAAFLLGAFAGPVAAAGARGRVQANQVLAVLSTAHAVYGEPRIGSPLLSAIAAHRPITGGATELPVLGRSRGPEGRAWLKVMVPGRPNGSTGWIAAQGTRAAATGWRIRIDLARRLVTVYRHGGIVKIFKTVVGKPSTPTPTGRFFVEETLQMSAGEPGGPFALALSARSDVLHEFEGGPGQIAMHGRDHLGGTPGKAESHGCMRLYSQSIAWLAARIGPGVPVTILPI